MTTLSLRNDEVNTVLTVLLTGNNQSIERHLSIVRISKKLIKEISSSSEKKMFKSLFNLYVDSNDLQVSKYKFKGVEL